MADIEELTKQVNELKKALFGEKDITPAEYLSSLKAQQSAQENELKVLQQGYTERSEQIDLMQKQLEQFKEVMKSKSPSSGIDNAISVLELFSNIAIEHWNSKDGTLQLSFCSLMSERLYSIALEVHNNEDGSIKVESVTAELSSLNEKIQKNEYIKRLLGTDKLGNICYYIMSLLD